MPFVKWFRTVTAKLALIVGVIALIANQTAATGRTALVAGLVCGCCLSWAFWNRRFLYASEEDDVNELRNELEALRLAAATQAANQAGLPPMAPPAWDPPAPANDPSASPLNDLHNFLAQGAAADPQAPSAPQNPPSSTVPGPTAQNQVQHAELGSVCTKVVTVLTNLGSSSGSNPAWARSFWLWVSAEAANGSIPAPVMKVLESHGYVGPRSISTPNVAALSNALTSLAVDYSPMAATTNALTKSSTWVGGAECQFTRGLPSDLRRAAPEIYRSIRQDGHGSVRSWLKENFTGYKGAGSAWEELWTMASQVDMALADLATDGEVLTFLATNDQMEVCLRHLGAHQYQQRTRDRTGAAMMRAISTPGSGKDVVPSWMVNEATTFSKSEFQRGERVATELKRRNADSDKGKGRGGKAKADKS